MNFSSRSVVVVALLALLAGQSMPVPRVGSEPTVSGGSFVGGTILTPILLPAGSKTAPSLAFSSATSTGIFDGGGGTPTISIAGTNLIRFNSNQLVFNVNTVAAWSTGDPTVSGVDTGISRTAAGVVSAGNGAGGDTSGTFRAAGFTAGSSAGQSVTTTVRAAGGAADCTLIFTGGLKTGGSC